MIFNTCFNLLNDILGIAADLPSAPPGYPTAKASKVEVQIVREKGGDNCTTGGSAFYWSGSGIWVSDPDTWVIVSGTDNWNYTWAGAVYLTTGATPPGGGPADSQFQHTNNLLGAPDEAAAERAVQYAAELPEPQLVVNRYRAKMVKRGDMMDKDDILEILAIPLIGIIPESEEVIVTSNRGTPAVFTEDSIVGEALRRIARRIEGEKDVPFVALEQPDNIWTTFKRWMGLAAAKEVVG